MSDLSRRFGVFKVTMELINRNPEEVLSALNGVLVLVADMRQIDKIVDYMAWSEHFRELSAHETPPEYIAEITRGEDGSLTVKWVEQE